MTDLDAIMAKHRGHDPLCGPIQDWADGICLPYLLAQRARDAEAKVRQVAHEALSDAASAIYDEWPGGTGQDSLIIFWAEEWLETRSRAALGGDYERPKAHWCNPGCPDGCEEQSALGNDHDPLCDHEH